MLTKKQQEFLLILLVKDVTKKDNKLYGSAAFYRMISYMRGNGLVKITEAKNDNRTIHVYSLTLKGSFLARLLASFTDVKPEIKKEYGLM
jgi:DNA-binding PadR family transcriptional regulator